MGRLAGNSRRQPSDSAGCRDSSTGRAATGSWASHKNLVGEGLSVGAGGVERCDVELAEPKLVRWCRLMRLINRQLALRRRATQRDRFVLGKLEVHEDAGIIDFDPCLPRGCWHFQQQGEMQDEGGVLVFQPIVDRVCKLQLLAIPAREGEIAVL